MKSLSKVFFGIFILAVILGGMLWILDQSRDDIYKFSPLDNSFLPEFLEKQSLQPPPPYKRFEGKVQGVMKVSSESGKIQYPHDYTIVLLGDSMTEALGNADELRGYFNEYYPDKTFEILNYGFGSTNIYDGRKRLTYITGHGGRDFRPALDVEFDYIIIESFGHNPLSGYENIEEGIEKQNDALDEMYALIATDSGREKIIFMSTIGTNKETYALNSQDLAKEKRREWALERDRYLMNHFAQAKFYGVPAIDLYTPSLNSSGNVKDYLVRKDDNIHPSPKGVLFISKGIADFFAKNNLIK